MQADEPESHSEDREDHRKHLEFIQLAILRMAGNSFLLKGWAATLAAAILAFAATESNYVIALPAAVTTLVFWGLDGYYVQQERLFRELYNAVGVTKLSPPVPTFSLNHRQFSDRVSPWFGICFSRTVWPFYVTVCLAAGLVVVVLYDNSPIDKLAEECSNALRVLQLSL